MATTQSGEGAGPPKANSAVRAPGRVIPFGKYLLLDRLAVGGMAEVYVAKSFGIEGFEKLLAIKRILPTMAEDHDFITMFVDEAKIAGQLSHPNIVPIYELGRLGDSHYMAMEYVWGKDLLQIMNRFRRLRKKMPPVMVAWIASKICEALDYAHSKKDRRGTPLGIIHRDISPQNVLVSYEGQIKLIDFGIAKAASRTTKTQAGVLKGKFGYMSPEQVRGQSIDHRSDIFAVGTCMYEMITSERLFLSESDFSTLEKVRNAEVAAPSAVVADMPPELEAIIMRALRREVDARYQKASEVREALQAFLTKHDPLFGTSKLSAWLKTAFGTELGSEKTKLDSFAQVGRPAVIAGAPRRADVETNPAAEVAIIAIDRGATPAARSTPDEVVRQGAYGGAAPRGKPTVPSPAPPRLSGISAAPRMPRPGAESRPPEPHEEDPLRLESTQVTPSPFDGTLPGEDLLAEQPTQIFWSSADDAAADGARPPGPSTPSAQAAAPPALAQETPVDPVEFSSGPLAITPESSSPGVFALPDVDPGGLAARTTAEPDPAGFASPLLGTQTPVGLSAPDTKQPPRGRQSRGRVAAYVAASVLMAVCGAFVMRGFLKEAEPGTIEIRTVPPVRATVRIDGQEQWKGSRLRFEGISAAEHEIELSAEGYEPTSRRVAVSPGSLIMLEIALIRREDAAHEFALGAGLPGPAVVIPADPGEPTRGSDASSQSSTEQSHGRGTPEPIRGLRGQPPAEAARPPSPRPGATHGHAPTTATPALQPGTTHGQAPTPAPTAAGSSAPAPTRVDAGTATGGATPASPGPSQTAPAPAARATGTLVINTIPWARVFIDGRDTGQSTPVRSLQVSAGTHQLGLRTRDGTMHTFTVNVAADATERFTRAL